MKRYGIRNLPLDWFSSYLENRKSYVGLGKFTSYQSTSNIGVPQGSILGPILFLIYINDFPKYCPNLHTTLFADDTTISFSHSNFISLIETVNIGLQDVNNWTLAKGSL